MGKLTKWSAALTSVMLALSLWPTSAVWAGSNPQTVPYSLDNVLAVGTTSWVTNPAVSSNPFKMNGANTTAITYNLAKDSKVSVEIYNGTTLVRRVSNSLLQKAGSNHVFWDGKNSLSQFVPDGVYTYQIRAVDTAGIAAPVVSGSITTQQVPHVADGMLYGHTVEPFVPDGQTGEEIHYRATTRFPDEAPVRIKIFNAAGELIYLDRMIDKEGVIRLGGILSDNKKFPNGQYTVELDVYDGYDHYLNTVRDKITVEQQPQLLRGYPIKSVGTWNFRYQLLANARVTVGLYDINNRLVNSIYNDVYMGAGTQEVALPTYDLASNPLVPGPYKWVVDAVDATGKRAQVSGLAMYRPNVTEANSTNLVAKNNTIMYDLTGVSYTEVSIYDSEWNHVRNLSKGLQNGRQSIAWDGKNDAGAVMPDGPYNIKVTTRSAQGIYEEYAYGSIVKSAGPSDFYYVTARNESNWEIFFKTDVAKTVTVKLYDSAGALVKVLRENTPVTGGSHWAGWNGRNTAGALMPNGIYKYVIEGKSHLGAALNPVTGTIKYENAAPIVINKTTSPAIFKPNGRNDFRFDFWAPLPRRVEIFDSNKILVKTIENTDLGSLTSGNAYSYWDGKDATNTFVKDGTYTYRMTGQDGHLTKTGTATGEIIVDGQYPIITGVGSTPEKVTDKGTINFTLSEPSTVRVEISESYSVEGREKWVHTLTHKAFPAGANSVTWDGKNDVGVQLPDRPYRFKIYALDSAGNVANEASGIIDIDKSAPEFLNVKHPPTDYTARTGDMNAWRISYSLNKAAEVRLHIFNSAGQTVFGSQGTPSHSHLTDHAHYWYTTQLPPPGEYTYRLTATDRMGRVAEPVTGTIRLTNQPRVYAAETRYYTRNELFFSYTVSELSYVSIQIQNNLGQVVRTIPNSPQQGPQLVSWNTTNDLGQSLPEGTYSYKIIANYGYDPEEVSGTLKIDRTQPVINDQIVAPDFMEAGKVATTFTYQINEPARITAEVRRAGSTTPVKVLMQDQQVAAGKSSVVWDGTDANGQQVSAGQYQINVKAIDEAFNIASVDGTVTLNALEGGIGSSFRDGPDPLQVSAATKSTISFAVTSGGIITVELYNSQNQLIRTLAKSVTYPRGTNVTLDWDGKNNAGSLVSDGVYSYRVTGTDLAGVAFKPITGGTITTDTRPPAISNVKTSMVIFSPTSSGRDIGYSLDGDATVRVGITNSKGELVKLLASDTLNKAGSHTLTWDGKDSADVAVPEGAYNFFIIATDAAGLSHQVTGTFNLGVTIVISDVTDSPDPLKTGVVPSVISYKLNQQANVTIQIYNQSGQLVRTLMNNVPTTAGTKSMQWDGKNDAGVLVEDGIYTYKINATDDTGGKAPEMTGRIITDKTVPDIVMWETYGNMGPIGPFNPAKIKEMLLVYRLNEDATVTAGIYNSSNVLVKTLASNAQHLKNEYYRYWDGKDDQGTVVPDGTYVFRVTATDAVGWSKTTTRSIGVRQELEITAVSDSPDPLKLGTGAAARINFTLSDSADVYITIHDRNGNLVARLNELEHYFEAGAHYVLWNGTNEGGQEVPEDTYTYKISANPFADEDRVVATGTITVDKTPPAIGEMSAIQSPLDPATGNMTMNYSLSEDAKVSAGVYAMNNTLIKMIVSNVPTKAGKNSVTWDGKNTAGVLVPKGSYLFKVAATDAAGFSKSAQSTFAIGTSGPVISAVSDNVDPLKVTETTASTIAYTLSEQANVTLKIYDSKNVLVRTLVNNVATTAGAKTAAWNGKDDAGALVGDGIYTYKINAVNSTGAAAPEVSGTITTDKTVPVISNITATSNVPATTGAVTTATIKYDLSEAAKVTLGIYNSSNVLVKTLATTVQNNAGSNSVLWDGKDSNGAPAPAGTYTYKLLATDQVGFSQNATGTFRLGALVPVISDVRDINDPLKATGTVSSTIYYTLSEAANVTIKVYDKNNTLVRTLVNNVAQTAGPKPAAWNGANDAGAFVEDGTYTYKINAVNSRGTAATEVTGTITTDKNAPLISGMTATPSLFNPSGGLLNLQYTLNEDAKTTVSIYNASNVLVKTITTAVPNKAGVNTVTWDGKNSAGTVVPNGTYSFRILATDVVGLSRNASGTIKVDNTAKVIVPVISDVSDINDPLRLTGTTSSTIYYTLSAPANVTLKIYDSTNRLVRTLVNNVAQTAGKKPAAWNGLDDAGLLVAEGVYTYKINAVDAAGIAAVEMSGTITTDKTAPTLTNLAATPSPFSATRDGNLSIKYDLNEDSKVTVSIYNASNVLVRTISSAVLNKAGTNTVTWDGKDNNGTRVPNASYVYRIVATDLAGLSRSAQGVVKVE